MFELGCVVRELVAGVCGSRVSQQDARDLAREGGDHLWVVVHDVVVARVADQYEFALRKGLDDFCKQRLAHREGLVDGREVERTCVEGAGGVGVVDKLHIDTGGLFGGRGEVVEVVWVVGMLAQPRSVDLM